MKRGHSRRRARVHYAAARRPCPSSASTVVALLGNGLASSPAATAPTSGWYVATVPGTGADDVPLGSACASAFQCWVVGISLTNLSGGGPSSVSPLMESWHGSTWTLVAPSLPSGDGGGLFGATCVNGSDCWAVGAVVASGASNPTGTLVEHWVGNGMVARPEPKSERSRRGRCDPHQRELRVSRELLRRGLRNRRERQQPFGCH